MLPLEWCYWKLGSGEHLCLFLWTYMWISVEYRNRNWFIRSPSTQIFHLDTVKCSNLSNPHSKQQCITVPLALYVALSIVYVVGFLCVRCPNQYIVVHVEFLFSISLITNYVCWPFKYLTWWNAYVSLWTV